MTKIPLFPRPLSWLSAVLLYTFLSAWLTFVSVVLPRLIEMGDESPRLAILGYLAVWVSPVAFVAVGQHVLHLVLDRAEVGAKKRRSILPGLTSWWAGLFAWLVIMFASSVVMFLLLALNPPERDGMLLAARSVPTMFLAFAWPFAGAPAGLHTVAWVLVAAQLYDLEHAVKARAARGET
jgi:hypothetical protein